MAFFGYAFPMPRPKKPPGELRDNTLRIRLTEAERNALDAAAAAKALDTSAWARSELLMLAGRVLKGSAKQKSATGGIEKPVGPG